MAGSGARRAARRHHGRRPAVLPTLEQPPVDASVRFRHSAGERHSRRLHLGCGGPNPKGAQSGPVGVQSLFRGWYHLDALAQSRSIAIAFKLLTRQHSFALINIPVVSF